MLEGSAIAAILTGVLALVGAVAAAWMSGWNEHRLQARQTRKALARYSVPLLIASWDLANWFHDILDDRNYSPHRCKAYGSGWNSRFTSYLIGQYFAGVHIIREKTHFLAHVKGTQVDALKKLLWKISDEFISMHYEGRESLEMRWFEGDILAVQEHMTELRDPDAVANAGDMQTIGWNVFQQKYKVTEPGPDHGKWLVLKNIFDWYEIEFQRIVYRRFKHLYSTRWKPQDNPQLLERQQEIPDNEEVVQRIIEEEKLIEKELRANPEAGLVIPDHRVRRLQHLLSDLVELLDEVSTMKFNRPSRRCSMLSGNKMHGSQEPARIPCDCRSIKCNPEQGDFEYRQLGGKKTITDSSSETDTSDFADWAPSRQDTLGLRRKQTEEKGVSRV